MARARYAQIADLTAYGIPAAAVASVSDSDKNAALDAASAMVDSYIGSRFKLPLSNWGLDITVNAARIAAYYVMNKRGYQPGPGGDSAQIREGFEDSIRWLKDVAQGNATPAAATDSSIGSGTTDSNDGSTGAIDAPFTQSLAPAGVGCSDKEDQFYGTTCGSGSRVGTPKPRGW